MRLYKRALTRTPDWQHIWVRVYSQKHTGRKGRGEKRNPTTESVKAHNQRMRIKEVHVYILSYFREGDHWLCLTYDDNHVPESEEEALNNVRNFKRRIDRKCKPLEIEVFALWNVEKGAEKERFHHHMIMNQEVERELIEECWGYGIILFKRLDDKAYNSDDYYSLAEYIVKQSTAETCDGKKNRPAYHKTRNIKKPITKISDVQEMEVKEFKDYEVVDVEEHTDPITGLISLEYRMKSKVKEPQKHWHRGKPAAFRKAYPTYNDYMEEQLSLFEEGVRT
ncbi:MAG: hypothetical protein IKJ77_00250 [Firmicutes bacterium]|nr:hypothetical protein [Bacillota bacterium]